MTPEQKSKLNWFGGGFLFGILLCAPVLWNGVTLAKESNLLADDVHKLSQMTDKIAAERDACQARFNVATVIADPASESGTKILNGLLEIKPGGVSVLGTLGDRRWYIPADVRPIVYGEPRGAVYYHYDPVSSKLDGPFLPLGPNAAKP